MEAPREAKSSKRIKAEYSELKLHPNNGIKAGKGLSPFSPTSHPALFSSLLRL
jgi:hypothetical protein